MMNIQKNSKKGIFSLLCVYFSLCLYDKRPVVVLQAVCHYSFLSGAGVPAGGGPG
jgi:hypothetical protein